jgi:hypothetical protein
LADAADVFSTQNKYGLMFAILETHQDADRWRAGHVIFRGILDDDPSHPYDIKFDVKQKFDESDVICVGDGRDELKFKAIKPEIILVDKLMNVSCRTILKRPKDFYDLHVLSFLKNYTTVDIVETWNTHKKFFRESEIFLHQQKTAI